MCEFAARNPGDELKAENRGTAERPRYHVLGFLTGGDQLRLPGGTFSRGDRAALKDYFERLGDDGAEALTARRGRFGLTEKELEAVTADLAQPIDFETKGRPVVDVLGKLVSRFGVQRLGTRRRADHAGAAQSRSNSRRATGTDRGYRAGNYPAQLRV